MRQSAPRVRRPRRQRSFCRAICSARCRPPLTVSSSSSRAVIVADDDLACLWAGEAPSCEDSTTTRSYEIARHAGLEYEPTATEQHELTPQPSRSAERPRRPTRCCSNSGRSTVRISRTSSSSSRPLTQNPARHEHRQSTTRARSATSSSARPPIRAAEDGRSCSSLGPRPSHWSGPSRTPKSRSLPRVQRRGGEHDCLHRPIIGLLRNHLGVDTTHRADDLHADPRRGRVLAAKYAATITVSVVDNDRRTCLRRRNRGRRRRPWRRLVRVTWRGTCARDVIVIMLQAAMAAGFGSLAGSNTARPREHFSPLPTAFASVSTELLGGLSPWFDIFATYSRLWSNQSFDNPRPDADLHRLLDRDTRRARRLQDIRREVK